MSKLDSLLYYHDCFGCESTSSHRSFDQCAGLLPIVTLSSCLLDPLTTFILNTVQAKLKSDSVAIVRTPACSTELDILRFRRKFEEPKPRERAGIRGSEERNGGGAGQEASGEGAGGASEKIAAAGRGAGTGKCTGTRPSPRQFLCRWQRWSRRKGAG